MNALFLVRAQARNNAWANHRFYAACARLSREELHATRVSFFPTLMKTLNHNVIVDWFYVDALTHGGRGRRVFETAPNGDEPFDELGPLAEAQRAVDRQLVAFADGLRSEADLDAEVRLERSDHVAVESAGAVLEHLYQHQIHHRGQAHAMLAGTTVAPPQLDEFFLAEDLRLRQHELALLG